MMRDHFCSVRVGILLAVAGLAAPCFAAPVNDNRANATPIVLGASYPGTTVTGTNEGGLGASCGGSATSPDVWYRFDATSTTGVTVSTCGAASFDTVLTAFQAGAGATLGTELVCLDDGSGCGTQTTIEFGATAGNTYWIRVSGYNGATGTFTLATSQSVPPPPTPFAHPTQSAPPGGMPSLPPTPARTSGPDVTVGNLSDTAYYGGGTAWMADSTSAGLAQNIYSYAVGTDSWNIGDRPVEWQSSNQLHPVIGQQMYRWKNGRLEQIGMSWLKHGFASTNSGGFPDMGACDSPPSGGAQLGVNCSDLYGSGLNGGRSYLGPRFEVNPTTGVYTYPWNTLVGTYSNTDVVARRIAVDLEDIRGDTNTGAYYLVDCNYTTQDDAQWGNGRNNYSARMLQAGTLFNTSSVGFIGSTYRRTTALELWARMDPTVTLGAVDMVEQTMNVTDKWRPWTSAVPDAIILPSNQWVTSVKNQNTRYLVGSKAINNGNGTWDYEYAVMNLNSRRAGGSFAVRVPAAPTTDIGFRAPKYHSGERILNNPWTNNGGAAGAVKWAVDPVTKSYTVPGMASSVVFNPNALGYGTMYNFRFRSSAAPTTGSARLGLFRAPNATGFQGNSLAITGIKVPTVCTADLGGQGGLPGPDGTLDNNDFIVFIDAFFNEDMLMADIGSQGGVASPDNALDNNDFIIYIDAFFDGCGV